MTAAMLACLLIFVGCIVAALAAWYRLDREARVRAAQLEARGQPPAPDTQAVTVGTARYEEHDCAPDVWLN